VFETFKSAVLESNQLSNFLVGVSLPIDYQQSTI